jgi:hypothetical protein
MEKRIMTKADKKELTRQLEEAGYTGIAIRKSKVKWAAIERVQVVEHDEASFRSGVSSRKLKGILETFAPATIWRIEIILYRAKIAGPASPIS